MAKSKNLVDELRTFLNQIKQMIEDNQIKPVIDRNYVLDDIREAHKYVDSGHKVGNVSITICK